MDYHRQITIFILCYFLLTACLCSQPTRSKRQKRGIMKMMMHIMWDPVRLIRYWYAYDVTKEIAKSWRKIIPTILLLPFTEFSPHSHGFAKYTHPTHGIRVSSKKKNVKQPSIPIGSYLQGSAVNMKPVAVPSSSFHEILHPQQPHETPHASVQYHNSKAVKNNLKFKHQQVPQIIVGHAPFETGQDEDSKYSIAHYFVHDGTSREEDPPPEALFPAQGNHNSEDIRTSSSQQTSSSEHKRAPYAFTSGSQESHIHYLPHDGTFQDENGETITPVLHPGQEVHIVLHTIPISDSSDGQREHFSPTHVRSNNSDGIRFDSSPILFKSIPPSNSNSHFAQLHDRSNTSNGLQFGFSPIYAAPSDKNGHNSPGSHETEISSSSEKHNINMNQNNNNNHNKTNSKVKKYFTERNKSNITWISQKSANLSNRTEQKENDLQSDGTNRYVHSVHGDANMKHKYHNNNPNGMSPRRHNINMERLREDLKHGTPVFIPFNRNTYTEPYTGPKDQTTFPVNRNRHFGESMRTVEVDSQTAFQVPVVNHFGVNSRFEQPGEKNTSQKLILFLKKKPNQ